MHLPLERFVDLEIGLIYVIALILGTRALAEPLIIPHFFCWPERKDVCHLSNSLSFASSSLPSSFSLHCVCLEFVVVCQFRSCSQTPSENDSPHSNGVVVRAYPKSQ